MTNDGMWPVGFFQRRNLIRAKLDIDRLEELHQMVCLGGTDDWRCHAGRRQGPRAGYLRRGNAALFRHLCDRISDREIIVAEVRVTSELIGLRAPGYLTAVKGPAVPGKETAGQRTPGNNRYTLVNAQGGSSRALLRDK
jgi:hypothetical protein